MLPPLHRYPSVDEPGARAAALAERHPQDAVVRRLPRRTRGALDTGRPAGRVPDPGGAGRVPAGRAARAHGFPFG